jgi:hypothetical protein
MQSATQQPLHRKEEEEDDDDDSIRGKTLKQPNKTLKKTHTHTHGRASDYFSVEGKEFYLVASQVPCPFLSSFLPSHALPKVYRMFLCWLSPFVRRERLQKKNVVFFSFGARF